MTIKNVMKATAVATGLVSLLSLSTADSFAGNNPKEEVIRIDSEKAYLHQADILIRTNPANARMMYQIVKSNEEKTGKKSEMLLDAYQGIAESYYREKSYDNAINAAKAGLKIFPDDWTLRRDVENYQDAKGRLMISNIQMHL